MGTILDIAGVSKTYQGGFQALKDVSLQIEDGEILALLGPNGAGKTTLISIICGLVNASTGTVRVGGHDIVDDYRAARAMIGLVPQEITLEPFDTVINALNHSRGLFGKRRDAGVVEQVLRDLSLWDKRDAKIVTLSGGMKRRVLIAKALVHEPQVLFLDEPTAGVDVDLRKDMWGLVERLRQGGVTIILTTHYIEEAEAIADRIGVISKGELLLVEDKAALMARMGKKQMEIMLQAPAPEVLADGLQAFDLSVSDDRATLTYTYDTSAARTGITRLLAELNQAGLTVRDIQTSQSTLEEIFVGLVREDA